MTYVVERNGVFVAGLSTIDDSSAKNYPYCVAREIDSGVSYASDGVAWWPSGDDEWINTPRLSVTPTVSAAAQSGQTFGGDGSISIRYLRYTVNAGDAVIAGGRLVSGNPDTYMLSADSNVLLRASVPLTRIDVLAIGSATAGTPAAGTCCAEGVAESTARTSMVTFEFDSGDNVLVATLATSPTWSATATFMRLHIEGRAHA